MGMAHICCFRASIDYDAKFLQVKSKMICKIIIVKNSYNKPNFFRFLNKNLGGVNVATKNIKIRFL